MSQLPLAVETLAERFLQNVIVIERLADEKRDLEGRVEELETQLHCHSFEPWWSYVAPPSLPHSPRSPRSARLARDYGKMTPRSARVGGGGGRKLLSASEAAEMFGQPRPKSSTGGGVGLSKHLLADSDRYMQRLAFIDMSESTARLEEQQHLEAQEKKRQEAKAAKVGPFRGLERRQAAAKDKSEVRAAERRYAAKQAAKEAERERRRIQLEHVNKDRGVLVSWDIVQANEETIRRERIENRKMQLYAQAKAPAAANPLPPKPEPEVLDTSFYAKDPREVKRKLLAQQRAFQRKCEDAQERRAEEAAEARKRVSSSSSSAAAAPSSSSSSSFDAAGRKILRAASAKQREVTAISCAILEEKKQLEALLGRGVVPLDATRPNHGNAIRIAHSARNNIRDKENQSVAAGRGGGGEFGVKLSTAAPNNTVQYHRHVYDDEFRFKQSAEFESKSKEADEFEAKEHSESARPARRGTEQAKRKAGPTLMERHSQQVRKTEQIDFALGFVTKK